MTMIKGKISEPWNTGHWPTYYILRGWSLCHTDTLSKVQHFSIKYSSRYEAKSLDHEIKVTDLHILDEVNLCVTLIRYTNYDVDTSNDLEDIKQNH